MKHFSTYFRAPGRTVPTGKMLRVSGIVVDLANFIARLANQGILTELSEQEATIRQQPAREATALLRQVFGNRR